METININPLDILKNAQKIQEQMGGFQARLGNISVTGSSGGGMVEIDFNGRLEVLAVRIDSEAMENREMLEDLVQAAVGSGVEKAREAMNREIGSLAGNLGIPGLGAGGFPFGLAGFPGSGPGSR